MTYGVTPTGFVKKPLEQIIEDKKKKARELFGTDVDLSPGSTLLHFIEVVSLEEAELWQELEDVYYSAFIDTATGFQLDRIGALFGIERPSGSCATGTVYFYGRDGVTIPAGTSVMTDYGFEFQTTADATIANGVASAPAVSVGVGYIYNVKEGEITSLVVPIAGVTRVSNDAFSGGLDPMPDDLFRKVIKGSIVAYAKATAFAIKEAIEKVGVESVNFVENTSSSPITVDGATGTITVAEHSAWFCVDGGSTDAITKAIEDTRPLGIRVDWSRPVYTYLVVSGTVTQIPNGKKSSSQLCDEVKNAIYDYISGLKVQEEFVRNEVIQRVMEVEEVYDIPLLTVAKKADGSEVEGNYQPKINERVRINLEDISITTT